MSRLALFPLNGNILLPGALLPLQVFEPRYVHLLQDTIGRESVGIIQTQSDQDSTNAQLMGMGCSGRIIRFEELENNRFFILLRGERRFHYIDDILTPRGYREAEIRWLIEPTEENNTENNTENIIDNRHDFIERLNQFLDSNGVSANLSEIEDTPDIQLIDTLAMLLPIDAIHKQNLLEAKNTKERLEILKKIIDFPSATIKSVDKTLRH